MTEVNRDIVSFTPAPGSWVAHFRVDERDEEDEEWEVPVIGWAMVRNNYTPGNDAETLIDPVVLDEGKHVRTLRDYCEDRSGNVYADVYQGLRLREAGPQPHPAADGALLRLTTEGPGSRDAIVEYVQSVIEQRTTPNDDTSAERLARNIVTSVLSRLGAGYSVAAGSTVEEGGTS